MEENDSGLKMKQNNIGKKSSSAQNLLARKNQRDVTHKENIGIKLYWSSDQEFEAQSLDGKKLCLGYRKKLNFIDKLSPKVSKQIQGDVQRSQYQQPRINSNLTKILKVVALDYAHSISYCQGMNYITGTVMHLSTSPGDAYSLVSALIERRFLFYYRDNFNNLVPLFYVLDALLEKFVPDLFSYLQSHGITSFHFSPS